MALTVNHPLLKEQTVHAYMADISTAGSAFVYVPFRGKIIKLGSVIRNAITVGDAAITTKISGTAITGGSWTIANAGSAAGDIDTAVPTAAHRVVEGNYIEFISDGGSTTTCPTSFFAVIQAE